MDFSKSWLICSSQPEDNSPECEPSMEETVTVRPGLPPFTEQQVITFPQGLPGFEGVRRYIILSVPQHEPFHWMEAVEGPRLRFALVNPLTFQPLYEPKIKKADLDTLRILDPKELLLYVIVTLKQPLSESTANLMGPLFINIRERIGRQIIIENDAYGLRERLMP
jgi:flagellar assembly factor FliW